MTLSQDIDYTITPIANTVNGAARHVVHYMAIPFTEYAGENIYDFRAHQVAHIEHAKKMLHGQTYRAKSYGGGIVFQAYAGSPIKHVNAAIKRAEQALQGEEPSSMTELFRADYAGVKN